MRGPAISRLTLLLVSVVSSLVVAPSLLVASPGAAIADGHLNPTAVSQAARPSVVRVTAVAFIPPLAEPVVVGIGTGIVLDANGHILTSSHVLDDADRVDIALDDGRGYPARLVARDPRSDIAVLWIDATDLAPAEFGDSDALRVGQEVLALGFAQGFLEPPNPRLGVVIGLDGRISAGRIDTDGLIRTDLPLLPGDSGGPLLDDGARVVGLNTAIVTRRADRVESSYSIPINYVRLVAEDLLTKRRVPRPWLGIVALNLTVTLAQSYDVPFIPGVLIVAVHPNSPAYSAGVAVGDVLVDFAGRPISSVEELGAALARHLPGDDVVVGIVSRISPRRSIYLRLAEAP